MISSERRERWQVYTNPASRRDRVWLGEFAEFRDAREVVQNMVHDHGVPAIAIDTTGALDDYVVAPLFAGIPVKTPGGHS